MLERYLNPFDRGSILCLGCGDGYELDVLRGMGFTVTGVTNDPAELGDRDITMADIHDLPFQDSSFDIVYSKETLEHSISPWAALRESIRVLKPNGRFFHLISCGLEKQREVYHFSCFPDWLWVDLFRKTGHELIQILDGHATEYGFMGVKPEQAEEIPGWSYDLRSYMNGIRRSKLEL